MSLKSRADKAAVRLFGHGPCGCPVGPGGQPWAAPTAAHDENSLVAQCPQCLGSYRLVIVEEIVWASDQEIVVPT